MDHYLFPRLLHLVYDFRVITRRQCDRLSAVGIIALTVTFCANYLRILLHDTKIRLCGWTLQRRHPVNEMEWHAREKQDAYIVGLIERITRKPCCCKETARC